MPMRWSFSSTTGSAFSLRSQMMLLASERVMSQLPTMSFSRGVMKSATSILGSSREGR